MSETESTAATPVVSTNPRDAFTSEHQRKAWEIAAWCVSRAHEVALAERPKSGAAANDPRELLAMAEAAMRIATGAL